MSEPHPLRLRLAHNLKVIRQARGLTQEAMADLYGLHYPMRAASDGVKRTLGIDNVGCVAEALGPDTVNLPGPATPGADGRRPGRPLWALPGRTYHPGPRRDQDSRVRLQ